MNVPSSVEGGNCGKRRLPPRHWKIIKRRVDYRGRQRTLESVMCFPLAFLLHSLGESLSSIVFMCRRVGGMGAGVANDGKKHTDKRSSRMRFAEENKCRDKFVSPDVQMRRI